MINDLLERDIERGIVTGERLIITAAAYQCLKQFYKNYSEYRDYTKEEVIPHGEEFKGGWKACIEELLTYMRREWPE